MKRYRIMCAGCDLRFAYLTIDGLIEAVRRHKCWLKGGE